MSGELRIRPSLLVALANRAAFLRHLETQGTRTVLFVPGASAHRPGEEVDLELAFAAERMLFHTRGVVRWRRATPHPRLPAGLGVELLPSENRTVDVLLEFARGDTPQLPLLRRGNRRYPAMLDVMVIGPQTRRILATEDLSLAGCQVVTPHPYRSGERVALRLQDPVTRQDIDLQGEVRWHRDRDPTQNACGIEFVFSNAESADALHQLIEQIRSTHDRRAVLG